MISISTDHIHKGGNMYCWVSSWAGWLSHYSVFHELLSGNMICMYAHVIFVYLYAAFLVQEFSLL